MKQHAATLIICSGIAVLASACATKAYVREQVGTTVGATETRLSQRVDTQQTQLQAAETQLKATAEKTAANTQAIDATGQRLQTVDSRLGETTALATEAKKDAATVANALRDTESQMSQRFANRNNYSRMDAVVVYFDFNKADVKDQGFGELDEIAKALKENPNAVVELQGFADPRGSDRYNYQLTRDRVDAVTRYLVQKHDIDLRRIHAVGMGKAERNRGEKLSRDAMSKARRVEIRILAPQS